MYYIFVNAGLVLVVVSNYCNKFYHHQNPLGFAYNIQQNIVGLIIIYDTLYFLLFHYKEISPRLGKKQINFIYELLV